MASDVLHVPVITCDDDDVYYHNCDWDDAEEDEESDIRGRDGDWLFLLAMNTSSMSTVDPRDSGGLSLLVMNSSLVSPQR